MQKPVIIFIILSALSIASCERIMPDLPADDEVLDGPLEGLTTEEKLRFIAGDVAFNDDVFTKDNGLGPLFVATSCGSCHAGDGKGHPFTSLTRYGQTDSMGNQYLQYGGPQLQNRALPGFAPEELPAGVAYSIITPPANTGLGFLDAVTDATIISMADPNDANGDGISGIPNWITPCGYCQPRQGTIYNGNKVIGRFGKKAAAYDLLQQTANAYNQDMGITSIYESVDVHSGLASDPDVSTQKVHDVVFYLMALKAPAPRNQQDAEIQLGKQLFNDIGCNGCHRAELRTGPSDIAALSDKTFFPYTDLLLHDMGPVLDDGYTEGSAMTYEWRTPPLWGLGLSTSSQGGSYFLMHDGRAHSIEEAILLHGGEGSASRTKFSTLNEGDKKNLLKFLESL